MQLYKSLIVIVQANIVYYKSVLTKKGILATLPKALDYNLRVLTGTNL